VTASLSGYLTTISYSIYSQLPPPNPIEVSGITASEVLQTLSSSVAADNFPPDQTPNTGMSNSLGVVPDYLSATAPGGLPSNFSQTRLQVYTLSGYALTPANTITYFPTFATTSVQTMSH
jgi:hypothetical protein